MRRSRIRYVIEPVIHVLFWLGVYYSLKALTTTSFNVIIRTGPAGTQHVDGQLSFPYAWIVLCSLMVLFYSNTLWLFKKVIRYKSTLLRVGVLAGWFILLLLMNYFLVSWCMGTQGKMQYAHGVERIAFAVPSGQGPHVPPPPLPPFAAENNWLHMQFVIALVFLSILAVAIAEFFIKEWIRSDLTRSQAEAHQLSMEVRFLRSQVNPHFLFNTLNNLFSMAQKKGHDDLADGVSKLSGMMRYMIYESNTEKVYLQKEIEYLKNCIALHKLRYADSEVTVSFSHPSLPAIADVQVAPMLFIPFLENAFKHGVSIGQRCYIALVIAVDAGKLIFSCENTDHGAVNKLEEEQSGIGLANVKRHLELVYGGKHELRSGLEDGKFFIHLQIDLV